MSPRRFRGAATVLPIVLLALVWAPAGFTQAVEHASAPAGSSVPDSLFRRVDALFAEWDRPGSPGAAVAVVRNGELVHARGFGYANLEYEVPITPGSVFHIASVSKHFTTFAVHLLAQQGKLSLDDDIRAYLPELPDYGRTITIRHLIHHTSGLRDQWELLAMGGWRLDDVITREHILKMVTHQRELNFEPGAEHLYSNTGYTLMAEIAARVSGTSFREFTRERIFEPLGMRHTHFHDDHQRIVPNRAYSYTPAPEGGFRHAPLNYANVGATSLFTTVEDLARWDRNFYTGEVGGRVLLEEMLTRGVLNDGREIPYAHALVWGEYRGLRTVGHGGADAGYRTAFLRFPDQRLSVIVLSNLGSSNPTRLAQQVAEIYLEGEMKPVPRPRDRGIARPIQLSDTDLAELGGTYANPLNDQLRQLEVREGRLVLLAGPGYTLVPVSRTRFVGLDTPAPIEIAFERVGNRSLRIREVVDGSPAARYERVPTRDPAELEEYTGTYVSEELGTVYTMVIRDGRLVASHRRHEDTRLLPTFPDRFAGDNWWFRRVEFSRDAAGRIDGFRLSGSRVRNVRFEKQ